MKILIAEDNEDTRMVLTAALESRSYTVTCANNGKEALVKARADRPDLIISDIMMPEMDGFDFCRAIKTDDTLSYIPFIFYTATYIEEQDKALAMAAGASRFIIKPIEMSAFLALVSEVLDEYYQMELPRPSSPQQPDEELRQMRERVLTRKLDKKNWQLERERRSLAMSELKYKTLFESSGDAVMLYDDQVIFDCNHAALEMFGCTSRDELLGKHPAKLSPASQPGGMDSHQLADEHINKALKQGSNHFEWLHRRVDGVVFPADVRLTAMEMAGKVVLQGIVHDISARKHNEVQLRKLSSCVEQAGEGIIITDRDGTIEYVNPSFTRLTGYARDEAIGSNPYMLNSGCQDAAFYDAMWGTIIAGQTWQGKVIDKRKDGSFYPSYLTISPIHDQSNSLEKFTHFVAIQSDLTQIEDAEERFQQAQKMEAIGTLVGGIAHDFNNMLAGITGNLYLAKKKLPEQSDVVERLSNVEALSFRAADMIEQLLTFARKAMVDMKELPLTPFIKETMKFLRSSVSENIIMHENICGEALQIKGDSTQIHQVLMNLINNACDAVEGVNEPTVDVCLESFFPDDAFLKKYPYFKSAQYAHLSVKDNGYGIPEHQLEHLFEPFFTTKEAGKGTGLGLAMVFGAVKTHNGFVYADSPENKGSTFHVYIPLSKKEVITADTQHEMVSTEGQGELILLADDEEFVRETMTEILESLGYKVLQAKDGIEAVEVFKDHQQDIALAILDVVMPHCGGLELAKRIREVNTNMPIMFLTGYDKEHVLNEEDPMSNIGILSKPVNFDILSHSIRKMLD